MTTQKLEVALEIVPLLETSPLGIGFKSHPGPPSINP
jgi:hypothetical protein